MKAKTVIFADLDGTFLDNNYGCKYTKPIVRRLSSSGCSVVFCSSKTRSEIELYRKSTGINEPFISENGGAIFIPKNYFPFTYDCTKTANYNSIRLGASYATLREKLAQIKKKTSAKIVGFGDMTDEQLAKDAGLSVELAKLAREREYDEPFRIVQGSRESVLNAIKQEGLNCTEGGRYFHLTGKTDKGKAVAVLKNLYSEVFTRLVTFGIGDGPNDLSMLKIVNKPLFIKKSHGSNGSFNAWTSILRLTV